MKNARKTGEVTRITLVHEISELMVISQFGQMIRVDTKSVRAAGRIIEIALKSEGESSSSMLLNILRRIQELGDVC